MLHELVETANKIKGVISLWELYTDVCFLSRLIVYEENGKEAARVDASLHNVIVVIL